MTTEAFEPTPVRTIAGPGPYSVDHAYQEGGLIVRVLQGSAIVVLDPADYEVAPLSSETTGDVTLNAAIATTYAGDELQILRKTNPEQGWQGQGGARERSLERQLDVLTQSIQDQEDALSRTFKVASGVIGDLPGNRAGKALIFDIAGSPVPGPDADAITNAQANAAAAIAAAQAAAISAALAATFDPALFQAADDSLDALSGQTVSVKGLELLAAGGGSAIRTIAGIANGALCGVGEVTMHLRGIVPTGKLELNGGSVLHNDFPDLGAYLGTSPGDTIILPDMRGEGVRGWDNGRGVDVGRLIASFQQFAMEDHQHSTVHFTNLSPFGNTNQFTSTGVAQTDGPNLQQQTRTSTVLTGPQIAAETRMRNVAVMFCVQAEA
ncbi:MAG: phage tail protein [Pseudomonadota bacterium]